ncbi:OmpH family outer membrane protein [Robertkochia solimangrovi]|uniref:OmpH family outer membrane protein n=1 Tax=Robertkochia solimangrovi TaxID=2213046 RepID=UPI00117F437F|nr:OmpH family outer membrane protein [Robertkochia solimangrovi]TRZ44419.1 OmpH family outer membrane protein [Robertkochia solimangrovi]
MKTKVLLIVIALTALQTVIGQRGVRIGYVDMEYILENVEEYRMANDLLAKKVERWKSEIEQQQATIQQMRDELNAEKVLLTKELIREREDEIDALEAYMLEYQQDRFGPQGDLVLQRSRLVQPIQDQVFNAVQELAAAKQYDFIFDKSADVVMLYSDKRYDISDQILRNIDITRKRNEREGKPNPALEVFEEIDPDLKAKEEEYEQKKVDRQSALEAKRQAKLKEIEERKKAYEERRKKMLEEREAKRKAKEEEKENEPDNENN